MAGRDGFVFFRGGTGRLLFFPRRDGAVVFFSRSGTGRLLFFSEAGRGGCNFFPRRDGAVVFFFSRRDGTGWLRFFSVGTGRLYFLFAPGRAFFFSAWTGRLTVVVFSAGTVLFIRVPSGGGEHFVKSVMVVHDMAPTVLPTGNDEDVLVSVWERLHQPKTKN